VLIHRGFHLKASEGLDPATQVPTRVEVEGTLSRLFDRQIHDQQMVQVVSGPGTFQIPLMITDDIMETAKVDPFAVTN